MEIIGEPDFDSIMVDSKKLTIDITCKIKVKVDTDKIRSENILEKSKLLQNVEEKDKRIRELEEEVKRLKSQSDAATSDSQKQQIQNQFNENQRQFLIAKYERDIDIYDFSNNMNVQTMMDTANKLTEIDSLNIVAFQATVYCYRIQDQMHTAIEYCKNTIKLNLSPDLDIEAYTQLGDIYYNELDNKTEAKRFVDQAIVLVKKQYSKSQIEQLVNSTDIEIHDFGASLTGKSNSIRELYILKSDLEGANPTFEAFSEMDDNINMENKYYNIRYRTNW